MHINQRSETQRPRDIPSVCNQSQDVIWEFPHFGKEVNAVFVALKSRIMINVSLSHHNFVYVGVFVCPRACWTARGRLSWAFCFSSFSCTPNLLVPYSSDGGDIHAPPAPHLPLVPMPSHSGRHLTQNLACCWVRIMSRHCLQAQMEVQGPFKPGNGISDCSPFLPPSPTLQTEVPTTLSPVSLGFPFFLPSNVHVLMSLDRTVILDVIY